MSGTGPEPSSGHYLTLIFAQNHPKNLPGVRPYCIGVLRQKHPAEKRHSRATQFDNDFIIHWVVGLVRIIRFSERVGAETRDMMGRGRHLPARARGRRHRRANAPRAPRTTEAMESENWRRRCCDAEEDMAAPGDRLVDCRSPRRAPR